MTTYTLLFDENETSQHFQTNRRMNFQFLCVSICEALISVNRWKKILKIKMRICFIFFRFSIFQHKRHRAKNQQLFKNRKFRIFQFILWIFIEYSYSNKTLIFFFISFCKIIRIDINIFLNWYKSRSKKQLFLIVFIF